MQIILISNDNVIELDGLQDVDGTLLNGATVEVHLRDDSGTDVVGQTWPLTMPPTGSDGRYRATLPDTLTLAENARYVATVTANDGPGSFGTWILDCKAKTRRA